MKPKERFYNYALLQANCDRTASAAVREDSPIDLSTKRQSPIVHSFSDYQSNEFDAHSIASSYNEWTSKYLMANSTPRNLQSPSNLLPYLLLNRTCYDVPSVSDGIGLKSSRNGIIHDSYGIHEHSVLPMRASPIIDICKSNVFERASHNGSSSRKSSANISSSSSSSPSSLTHNSSNEYNETRRLLERSFTDSSASFTSDNSRINRSQPNQPINKYRISLKRSKSFPSLINNTTIEKKYGYCIMAKSKSEDDILKILRKQHITKLNAQSTYYNRNNNAGLGLNKMRIESPYKYSKLEATLARRHHNNGNNIDFSDQERDDDDDAIGSGVSDDYGSDDALDLRITSATPTYRSNYLDHGHPDSERIFHHINSLLLNQVHSPRKEDLSPPIPTPLDLYRQYYYYLMHQPAFASRAAAAVAMAETYTKLLTTATGNNQSPVDYAGENDTSKYEDDSGSPDYIINGTRAELRSADTTNNGISFDRKRISRPLTGKHVRHGTGASPSTLLTLRNMIQERQRLKDIGIVSVGKYGKGKNGKRVKRK